MRASFRRVSYTNGRTSIDIESDCFNANLPRPLRDSRSRGISFAEEENFLKIAKRFVNNTDSSDTVLSLEPILLASNG